MIDVTPQTLLMYFPKEDVQKMWDVLAGCRIYFPKSKKEHYWIIKDFEDLQKREVKKADAIRLLSQKYQKSQSQIRFILKNKNMELFDDRK